MQGGPTGRSREASRQCIVKDRQKYPGRTGSVFFFLHYCSFRWALKGSCDRRRFFFFESEAAEDQTMNKRKVSCTLSLGGAVLGPPVTPPEVSQLGGPRSRRALLRGEPPCILMDRQNLPGRTGSALTCSLRPQSLPKVRSKKVSEIP